VRGPIKGSPSLLENRPRQHQPPSTRNPEPLGSGGSTVARLKLKGIDGMTPPGVEYAA